MAKTRQSHIMCKHCKKRKNSFADDGTPMTAPIRCTVCRNCSKLQQQKVQKMKPKKHQQNKNLKADENIRNILAHLNEIKVQVKNDTNVGIATATDVKPKPKVVELVDVVELSSDDDDDSLSPRDTKKQEKLISSTGRSISISIINDTINLDDTAVDEAVNKTLNFTDVSTQSEDCIVIADSDSDDVPTPRKVQMNKEIGCISHLRRNAEDSVLNIYSPEKVAEDSVLNIYSPVKVSKIRKSINKPSQKARNKTKKQKRLVKQQLQKSLEETKQSPKAVQKPTTPKQQTCGSSKGYCKAEEFWGPAVLQPSEPKPPSIDVPINERPLREIIVDGQNVARGHDRQSKKFSVRGIQLIVEHFQSLGHKVVVFLPNMCQGFDNGDTLKKLEDQGILIYTPSRKVKGQRIQPYDDRYIIDYASRVRGIVVSRDQFRDLIDESPQFHETIVSRLLMYTFVGDHLMFPYDPLGKKGPSLDEFLRLTPLEMQQGNQETCTGNQEISTANQGTSILFQEKTMANQGTSSGISTANQGTSSGISTANQGTSILFQEKTMANQGTSSGISTANQGTSILFQEKTIANQGTSILTQEMPVANQGMSIETQGQQGTSMQLQPEKQEVYMEVSQEKEEQSPPSQDQSEHQADISVVIIN